jgi:hypothetical protein
MRYSLHEIDTHHVVGTTVSADRDEALEWFSEKLRLMLTFEGDPLAATRRMGGEPAPYGAHFSAFAAHPQASQGAGFGQIGA